MDEDWDQWVEHVVKTARPHPTDSRVVIWDEVLPLEDVLLYSLWCQESACLMEAIRYGGCGGDPC